MAYIPSQPKADTFTMTYDIGSRSKLTPRALPHFQDASLFHRIARVVCRADCLPRKELYESWEVARRARRRFKGGRVVDLGCGHGLVAQLLLLLDASSPTALAVDARFPESAVRLAQAMAVEWPRLSTQLEWYEGVMGSVPLRSGDLVVSAHACGALTDEVIGRAIGARSRLAVLPCCHDKASGDQGGLGGWLDAPLAMDVTRAARLRAAGYRVYTQCIPVSITPKNRLLLAEPEEVRPGAPSSEAK